MNLMFLHFLRVCDVHQVPLATNVTSGELLLLSMEKNINWKSIRDEY